jgi:hypothetical protein
VSQGADLKSEYGGDENVAASLHPSFTSFRFSIFKVLFLAGRRVLKYGSMLLKKSISMQVLFNSSNDYCLFRVLVGGLALVDAERTAGALCWVPLVLEA